MTNTVPPPTSTALAAWRRITAAIDTGAPVPSGVEIGPTTVTITYHPSVYGPETVQAAAAMVRALGLHGPVTHEDHVTLWRDSLEYWRQDGMSWSVWARRTGGGAS